MSAGKILVVDDDPQIRRVMRATLSGKHYEVLEARNGAEALERFREEMPDLVLLDMNMPGMDGFAVLEAIGTEHMPAVIFVTAYDQYAVRAFEVQALDYLLKPFDQERFDVSWQRARAQA